MEIRTDRVGALVDQLKTSLEFSRPRLDGMTDDEFLWEPVRGMWSIRPGLAGITPEAFGPGDHVLDLDTSIDPFDVGPMTTIAWRIGHLVSGFAGRYEWTFGDRCTEPKLLVDFVPHAEPMLARLWSEIDRWITAVEGMTDAQLDQTGFGQYPYGLDPQIPFIGIVWWTNREAIQHLGEVALLRDLYAARSA